MDAVFEIFTKEVEIKVGDNVHKYTLRPLSGRFLPKLYSVIGKLQSKDEEGIGSFLEEDTIKVLHELILETFRKSYPNEDENKLDEFVSQNIMLLLEAVIEVNINDKVPEPHV